MNKKLLCTIMTTLILAGTLKTIPTLAENTKNSTSSATVKITAENKKILSEKEVVELSKIYLKNFGYDVDASVSPDIYFHDEPLQYSLSYRPSDNINFYLSIEGDSGLVNLFNVSALTMDTNSNPISYEDAKAIAHDKINSILDTKGLNLVLDSKDNLNNLPDNYTFIFRRTVNEIPFDDQYVSISINPFTKKICSLLVNINNNIDVEPLGTLKSLEDMDKKFRDNTKVNLQYQSFGNNRNMNLMYSIGGLPSDTIFAKTGDFQGELPENESPLISLSKKEKENIIKAAEKNINTKELSKEEIKNVAKSLLIDIFTEKVFNENIGIANLFQEPNGWHISFKHKDQDYYDSIELSKFGEVNNIFLSDSNIIYKKANTLLTPKEAYDKIIKFVITYMPSKVKNLNLNTTTSLLDPWNDDYAKYYHINFQPTINDIPCNNQFISIDLNSEQGNIVSCLSEFPQYHSIEPKDNIISHEKAKEILLSKYETTLKYAVDYYDNDTDTFIYNLFYCFEPKAEFSNLSYLSAKTGKCVDYEGIDIYAKNKFFKHIETSSYKNEVMYLYSINKINPETFNKDKNATLLDFVNLIKDPYGYDYSDIKDSINIKCDIPKDNFDYNNVCFAFNQNIINNSYDEIKFLQPLTKEILADYLINYLQYNKLDSLNKYISLPYSDSKDINKKFICDVALVSALNLMKDENGKWNPKEKVTMEYLCKVLYETLKFTES